MRNIIIKKTPPKVELTSKMQIKIRMTVFDWKCVENAIQDWVYFHANAQISPLTRIIAGLYNLEKMLIDHPATWTINTTKASALYTALQCFVDSADEFNSTRDRLLLELGRFKHLLMSNG